MAVPRALSVPCVTTIGAIGLSRYLLHSTGKRKSPPLGDHVSNRIGLADERGTGRDQHGRQTERGDGTGPFQQEPVRNDPGGARLGYRPEGT